MGIRRPGNGHDPGRRRFLKQGTAGVAAALGLLGASFKPGPARAGVPDPLENPADVLHVEILRRGGFEWYRGLRYPQQPPNHPNFPAGTPTDPNRMWDAGPDGKKLILPPEGVGGVPMGYGMVPSDPDDPNSPMVYFLDKWGDQFLSILTDNGTNNHEVGRRVSRVGKDDMTYPSTPALFGWNHGEGSSLAWLTNYSEVYTGGLLSTADVGDQSGLLKLAYPNLADPLKAPEGTNLIHTLPVDTLLQQRRVAVWNALAEDDHAAPRLRQYALVRLNALSAQGDVSALLELLKQFDVDMNDPLFAAAKVAVIGKQQGLVNAVSLLQPGNHDTHGQNDGVQQMQLTQQLFLSLNKILSEAHKIGVRVLITTKSDFGRRPAGSGDPSAHWKIGESWHIGDGISGGPYKVGVEGPFLDGLNLVGEASTAGDVIAFQRYKTGVTVPSGFDLEGSEQKIINYLPA